MYVVSEVLLKITIIVCVSILFQNVVCLSSVLLIRINVSVKVPQQFIT